MNQINQTNKINQSNQMTEERGLVQSDSASMGKRDDEGMTRERRTQLHHGSNGRTVDLDQRVGLEDCLNG